MSHGHGKSTAPYGNYRGYYPRRRAKTELPIDRDERLALLEEEWFRGATILDVGCNVGAVSVEIAQRMRPAKVVGVDIDPHLIRQCRSTVEKAFSMENPRVLQPSDGDTKQSFSETLREESHPDGPPRKRRRKQKDVPSSIAKPSKDNTGPSTRSHDETHYFPSFFSELYGPIDPRAHKFFDPTRLIDLERQGQVFPHNLSFFAQDWVTDSVDTDEEGYDVILALSLTKWIHLNHLDEGLLAFFRKCHLHLRSGGRLILEKQGWDGYRTAKRGSEILTKNYFELKLRPEADFERILLEDIGFSNKELLRESDSGKGFDRDIEVYIR